MATLMLQIFKNFNFCFIFQRIFYVRVLVKMRKVYYIAYQKESGIMIAVYVLDAIALLLLNYIIMITSSNSVFFTLFDLTE